MKNPIFFTLVASLILTACQSAPTKEISKPTTPSWFINPPADTQNILYAVGAGESQDKAIKDALAYLAAKLSVSVSSTSEINKTVYDGVYTFKETQLNKQTTTQIKQVSINQFRQLNMQQVGYQKYLTLIESDKNKLAIDYQSQLNQHINQFKKDSRLHQHTAGYAKYNIALKHYLKLPHFKDILSVYKGLKPTANLQSYQQHLERVTRYTKQQQASTTFKIVGNDTQSKTTLAQYLSHIGFKVTNTQATNLIKLTSQLKTTNAEGFSIRRNNLTIQFYQGNTKITGNNLNLKGQGLNSQQAKTNEQMKLKEKLNKQGLNQFLGLKNDFFQ